MTFSTFGFCYYGDNDYAYKCNDGNDDENFELAIPPVHNLLELASTLLELIGVIF